MPEHQLKANQKKEWYKRGWGLVVAILFFPYFLVWYAWARSNWSKYVKIAVSVLVAVVMLPIFIGMANTNTSTKQTSNQATKPASIAQEPAKEQPKQKTPKEKMYEGIDGLLKSKDAFDAGSYVKGDIPVGEYAFIPFDGSGKYYSETDSAGNIIDNENFDSFGYVYVQGVGNIQTRGVLIKVSAFEKLGVSGAKDIYEKLNGISNYKESAMYKVGVDIAPGTYTIESFGQAYVEIMSGPVGKSDIVDNENFNGKYSVNIGGGQYLKVSRGKIL